MLPARNQKMVAEGVARLTDAFRNTNVAGFVKGWLASVQDLDDAAWSVINAIQNPTGDLLDRIAAIVGETRQGRSDPELLAAVKLRVLVNRSQGLADDIIRIARALVPTSEYVEAGTASWQVTAYDPLSPRTLLLELGRAKDGGSRGVVRFTQGWGSNVTTKWRSVHGSTATPTDWNSSHSPGFGDNFCSSQGV